MKLKNKRIIVLATGAVAIMVSVILAGIPRVQISASSQILSISLSDNVINQPSAPASYVATTVTKLAENSFDINFTGAKHKVHIGNGGNNFISRMLFGAWDDECLVDLQMEDITGNLGKATLTGTGEDAVISVENNAWKLVYKPVPPTEGFNEYGGIDYIMTLKRRTLYNTINFSFNATNCVAYHQPPLTQEEIDEGCIRPDHVVNSIVFYHNSKGGLVSTTDADRGVTTGKIGHLYRLRVTDANNNQTWADWTLSGNIVTLTVPLAFLQTATFPVVIAPVGDTFGYTSAGGTLYSSGTDMIRGNSFAAPASGTATGISIFNDSGSNTMRFAIYDDDDSDAYINETGDGTISASHDYQELTFSSPPSITSGINYWLCFYYESVATKYDSTGARSASVTQAYPGTMPDPLGTGIGTIKWSIYCTYTPAASYDITETTTSKAFGLVAENTTYYAKGSAPSNPVADGECTFTITNSGMACDLDIKMADFTGGVGWNIANSVGSNEVKITAYYSGQNPASGLVLTNSDQEFYDGLAVSGTIKWDFKFETGTFTDGVAKSGVLTITAVAED